MGKLQTGSVRNQSIELLRIASMSLIVMTHVLVNGGIIEAASFGTFNDAVLNVLQSFSRIGVNVFALITGYLSVG